MVRFINWELNSYFGHAYGDRVIQIGTVFWEYGDDECFHNNIITLRDCSNFKVGNEDCEIVSYDYKSEDSADRAESKILIEWAKLINNYDPDIIIGYNIFGFDEVFMYDRGLDLIAKESSSTLSFEAQMRLYKNDRFQNFINMGRLHHDIIDRCPSAKGKLINKKLSSSALGDNFLFYFNTPGRVQIDLLKVCQSSMTKLPSYKLDDVASFYISGKIKGFNEDTDHPNGDKSKIIKVSNIKEIDDGNFVVINMTTTGQQLYDGEKLSITKIDRENDLLYLNKPVPTDCLPNYPM